MTKIYMVMRELDNCSDYLYRSIVRIFHDETEAGLYALELTEKETESGITYAVDEHEVH